MAAPVTPAVGDVLPELRVDVTPTFVVSTALATRDFQDVHHDRDAAVMRGSKDIFLNILTTTGLVQRCVTDWAGPGARVRGVSIRLGALCHAGDTLVLGGRVVETGLVTRRPGGPARHDPPGPEVVVAVVGRCGLGDHVTGTVRVELP